MMIVRAITNKKVMKMNKNLYINVLVPENCVERLRDFFKNTSVKRKVNALFET